ncbi:MAG TPA: transposase [Dehalococcoidales bacterium]|nr:transposase [Dehalococcoidales bacterium]
MNTDKARTLYSRRKELNEPTFGIIKDQMNARKFLLRGLANVSAEFTLLATAFNLRTLWRIWSMSAKLSNKVKLKITDRLETTTQINKLFGTNHEVLSVLNFV